MRKRTGEEQLEKESEGAGRGAVRTIGRTVSVFCPPTHLFVAGLLFKREKLFLLTYPVDPRFGQ